jgi:outer membrane protein OmpA-like peptidoglycan-associated protein
MSSLWTNSTLGLFSRAIPSLASLLGDWGASSNSTPDDLVRFVERSLENNLITSSANPLLAPEERAQLVVEALQPLRNSLVRQRTTKEHQALAQEIERKGSGKEGWYEHVAVCPQVCLAAFSALVSRHFGNAGRNVYSIVFFEAGSGQLDSASRRDIQHFSALLVNRVYANRMVLLTGRASRLGAHGYNMELSERRVRAVRNEMVKWGVSPERIKTFWLGWEQPYLTRTIADDYRIPVYLFDDDEIKLNQSVEIVLY